MARAQRPDTNHPAVFPVSMRFSPVRGGGAARTVGRHLACLALVLTPWAVSAGWRLDALVRLDQAIEETIAAGKCPGAALWIEHDGLIYQRAYGQRAVEPAAEAMTMDTVFDVASLTKVVATTPAVLLLVERGQVQLDAPVRRFLPEFDGEGRGSITVRHLLTHTSGLRVGISGADFGDYAAGMAVALRQRPVGKPGTACHYCDVNFLLLGEIVRRVAGQPLDEFAAREIFQPLAMHDTAFRPPPALRSRTAPTQRTDEGFLRGIVQDPTARRMGGVAGHAGLFTTAADLARFARMMLNNGELEGVRVLRPETVRQMTSVQTPGQITERRGLGWDIDSGYSRPRGLLFPLGSYGHTGWTGVLLWIDPFSRTTVILLTNRLHPADRGNLTELYGIAGTLAACAVEDFDFTHVPGALPFRTNFIRWGTVTNWLAPFRESAP